MKPVGIGLIGTGFGLRTLKPAFEQTGQARVVALCASSMARAEELGAEHDVELRTADPLELCAADSVELIVVASPNDLHLEHARAALATGKHVYIEKPVGLNAAEARTLAALEGSAFRLVVVGHSLRFDPHVRVMRDLIRGGAVGRPYYASVRQFGGALAERSMARSWLLERRRGGGVALGTGSHILDVLRFLFDANPTTVAAATSVVHERRTAADGEAYLADADAFFGATVSYSRSLTAQIVTAAAAHVPSAFDIAIHGDDGALTFDVGSRLSIHRSGREAERYDPAGGDGYDARALGSPFRAGTTYLAEAIVQAIREGAATVDGASTLTDAVRCLEELDAARASAADGLTHTIQRVRFPA